MTLVQLDEAHALKKKTSKLKIFGFRMQHKRSIRDNKNLLRAVLKDTLVSSNTSSLLLK